MRIPVAASACMMLTMALWLASCSPSGAGSNASRSEPAPPPGAASTNTPGEPSGEPAQQDRAELPMVILEPPGSPPAEVTVELARTPRQIQRGLMYREHLPPDHGMLFLMGEERIQSFWMRNTLIPLDMIFISADRRVVGVVENAEPLTDTPRRVNAPSSYVLEVNGGWAAAHHVQAGTPVRFQDVAE